MIQKVFDNEKLTLEELFEKFQAKDIDYKISLVRETGPGREEAFELLGTLGSGRSCFVFLALYDNKLVSLRLSYEDTDFSDKFDSVRVEMEEGYDEYFLNIIYPSLPIDYLCVGNVKKKHRLHFRKKVHASFWEKAEATLVNRADTDFDYKVRWFKDCLTGLDIIHERGRAHFDIKLENLFVVNRRLKIGDFEYYLKIDDFISSKIFYCGTIGYIAPEMFFHRDSITTKIDIFSTGVAFARFFLGVERTSDNHLLEDDSTALTPEEQEVFETRFGDRLKKLSNEKARRAVRRNFKVFYFYKSQLRKQLEKKDLLPRQRVIYGLLLDMMSVDTEFRPSASTVIDRIDHSLAAEIPQLTEKEFFEDGPAGAPAKPPWLRWSRVMAGVAVVLAFYFLYYALDRNHGFDYRFDNLQKEQRSEQWRSYDGLLKKSEKAAGRRDYSTAVTCLEKAGEIAVTRRVNRLLRDYRTRARTALLKKELKELLDFVKSSAPQDAKSRRLRQFQDRFGDRMLQPASEIRELWEQARTAMQTVEVRTVTPAALPGPLAVRYSELTRRIEVPGLPEGIQVLGHIRLRLSVSETGRLSAQVRDASQLKAGGASGNEQVKGMILRRFKSLILPPPRDKNNRSVRVNQWDALFKIGTFQDKIILLYQSGSIKL